MVKVFRALMVLAVVVDVVLFVLGLHIDDRTRDRLGDGGNWR